jgi:hypothetical protein
MKKYLFTPSRNEQPRPPAVSGNTRLVLKLAIVLRNVISGSGGELIVYSNVCSESIFRDQFHSDLELMNANKLIYLRHRKCVMVSAGVVAGICHGLLKHAVWRDRRNPWPSFKEWYHTCFAKL